MRLLLPNTHPTAMSNIFHSCVLATCMLSAMCANAQQYQGTPKQRDACTGDAFRLCQKYIPDPARVEICLRQNMAKLSEACRLVFDPKAAQGKRKW